MRAVVVEVRQGGELLANTVQLVGPSKGAMGSLGPQDLPTVSLGGTGWAGSFLALPTFEAAPLNLASANALAALLGIFLDLAQTAPQHHLITVLPYLALQCAVSWMRKGRRRSGSRAASFASNARSPAPPSQPAPPTQQWFGALAAHGQWVPLWSPVGHIGQALATGRT